MSVLPSFGGSIRVRTLCLIAVEHLVIVIAVYAAAAIRFGLPGAVDDPAHEILWRASLIGLVLQICLHYSDLYDFRTLTDRRELLVGLIQALGAASLVLALLYYWIPDLIIGRGVFVIASAFIVSLVAGWRFAFEWLSRTSRAVRAPADRRHQRRVGRSGARAVQSPAGARRRARRVRRPGSRSRRDVAHQSRRHRDGRADSEHRSRAQRRSRRRQPGRRARQAADGRPARA